MVMIDDNTRRHTGPATLPADLFAALTDAGGHRWFAKNTIIVSEGEPAEMLYVVIEGELLVYADDESGKLVELNRLGAGDYFGELMLGHPTRTASIRTMTRTHLSAIPRADFERLVSARPDLAFHLIRTLTAKVCVLTERVRGLALLDVYGRVAGLLLESARDIGGRRIIGGLSQQAIGERVGASRSMVNRILQDLEQGGYVAVERGRIELLRALPKRW